MADTVGNSLLVLNAGSSSLKFALFQDAARAPMLLRGEITDIGTAPHLLAHDADGTLLVDRRWAAGGADGFATILAALLTFIDGQPGHARLSAVGHRIVHGGAGHIEPEIVTPELIDALEALIPLDPIHMPHNLAPIRAVEKALPGVRQVVCFDTAFHHTLPLVARSFGLPREVSDAGIRRYGFHGLSYEYIAHRLRDDAPALADGRVVVAHLGSGASLCALLNGKSIATTFGFSTLDGLLMATRCGSLDPGAILYLGRQGHSFADIEDMLYNRSGLLGVSSISGDIRVLLASDDARAREAIDLFTYRIAIEIGAMTSALGGLDGIVFTAGIGEHAPAIRATICDRLAWLGLQLNDAANSAGSDRISTAESRIDVRVIATDEEAMIAHHMRAKIARFEP